MTIDVEARIERLLDQLNDPDLSDRQIGMLEKKIAVLRKVQEAQVQES